MEVLTEGLNALNGIVWGVPMLVLILGTGLFLQIRLKLMPIAKIGYGIKLVWQGRKSGSAEDGEISPFAALMTALAATVGTGNIAGVATAIALGGPGALFWMWCTALVGMATKYAEVLLAVHYREVDENGEHVGGPMYAIKNGLGPRWRWLGVAFALTAGVAGFGIGNMVQANAIAGVAENTFGIPVWITGIVLTVVTGAVILGGIKRIGRVAESLVPLMCISYVLCALFVLFMFADRIPEAISLVFTHAFTPVAASGGFAGAAVWAAMRYGVARGIFSNEAGLGTAGIAQAAGMTRSPVRSALVGMMGTFIDTIIVCTMTGLAIIVSGVWNSGAVGSGAVVVRFRGGHARHRPVPAVDRTGGVRADHHPGLVVLRREVLGIPDRRQIREAVPGAVDAGRVPGVGRPVGSDLADRGYLERLHGDPKSVVPAAALAGDREVDPRIFPAGN